MKIHHILILCSSIMFDMPILADSFMSQYGQIQNVNGYSSNPFWNKNSPYNKQIIPQPVIATGPDLNTGDCQRVVENLISNYCTTYDNCHNMNLSDIRPTIMVQLSQLPGHNFATACNGFIDETFNKYKQTYENRSTQSVDFPENSNSVSKFKIQNPFEIKTPDWQNEIKERENELKELQSKNKQYDNILEKTDFPSTFADLSLNKQIDFLQNDYEQYSNKSAYRTINVVVPEKKKSDEPTDTQTNGSKTNASVNDLDESQNNSDENDVINILLNIFDPDTQEQKDFFTDLSKAYIQADQKDSNITLDNAFVLDFLGDNDGQKYNQHKNAIKTLTGKTIDETFDINIDWDDLLITISTVLDQTMTKSGILLCENNRSIQGGIDAVLWVATAIAAVVTIYAGGAGGTAVVAGRAAIGAGLKSAAKIATKVGAKKTGKKLSKRGGKKLAQVAIATGMKKNMRGYTNYAGKGVLKKATHNYVKKVGANLKTKKAIIADSGVLIAHIGKAITKHTAAGVAYSLVSSDIDKEIINCQDYDHDEGCYFVCGDTKNIGKDDLNTKVFKPILGKTYCLNPNDYALYEMKSDGTAGNLMVIDANKMTKIKQTIKANVSDKGKCDWNEDDIDMYIGNYSYNPDTFEISPDSLYISDILRIDD